MKDFVPSEPKKVADTAISDQKDGIPKITPEIVDPLKKPEE